MVALIRAYPTYVVDRALTFPPRQTYAPTSIGMTAEDRRGGSPGTCSPAKVASLPC